METGASVSGPRTCSGFRMALHSLSLLLLLGSDIVGWVLWKCRLKVLFGAIPPNTGRFICLQCVARLFVRPFAAREAVREYKAYRARVATGVKEGDIAL